MTGTGPDHSNTVAGLLQQADGLVLASDWVSELEAQALVSPLRMDMMKAALLYSGAMVRADAYCCAPARAPWHVVRSPRERLRGLVCCAHRCDSASHLCRLRAKGPSSLILVALA
jgi:hypothetical protein